MSNHDDDGARGIGISFAIQGADSPNEEPATVERPVFRISVVAEAGARPEFSTGPEPIGVPLSITRTAFDQVMREVGPSLAIEVDDVFDPGGKPLEVDLRFSSYKSFKPQGVVDQVPALRALVDARRVLERVRKGQTVDTAREELARILPPGRFTDTLIRELSGRSGTAIAPETPTASANAGAGDGLDSLLAKVAFAPTDDAGSESGAAPGAARSAGTLADAATRVESAFSALLGSVLDHPEVARLESIWRSLWLLAAEARTESGVEVELIGVSADGITKGLTRIAEAAHRGPPDLIIVADTVLATARDVGALEGWAEIAEGLSAPLVVDGEPGLLGYDSLDDLARSTARIAASTDPRAVLLKSLAAKDAARWVAVTLNRPLARAAYTADTARVHDISLQGSVGGDRYLHGAFAIAVLAARSFVRFGIGSALTGAEHGKLENFPVHDWDDRGSTCAIPLQTFISSETLREIARAGVVALASARNHDAVIVNSAPVVYRGESVARGGDAAAPIGLGDQLFVGRFSYAVEQLAAAIPAGADPASVTDTARVVLHGFFPVAPPAGPEISARIVGPKLEVTVRPRRYAGIGLEEVSFAARLGAA